MSRVSSPVVRRVLLVSSSAVLNRVEGFIYSEVFQDPYLLKYPLIGTLAPSRSDSKKVHNQMLSDLEVSRLQVL